ncbi:MAG: MerR family DNA-binding protein [Candidatus Hydrogenedentes bacterium]|nr:MerR family DNA-binding protein [Candidatus Hydrogenedentota bacterium]
MNVKTTTPLTIGKVARLAEVGIETIRFYEREGLIPDPPRSESGYRHYGEDSVARIRFIKKAKALGFSLAEIGELLSLRAKPSGSCANVQAKAHEKIAEIDQKIETLQAMRTSLQGLVVECRGTGPRSKCPILNTLEAKEIP